jgi:hypothetical protein
MLHHFQWISDLFLFVPVRVYTGCSHIQLTGYSSCGTYKITLRVCVWVHWLSLSYTVKVEISPCFNWAPRYEGVLGEWSYSSTHSLTSALDRGEWSASHPGRFTPRERAPGTHWIGGWVDPRAFLDAVVKRKIPSPRRESNPRTPIVRPIAQCYTEWAITARGVNYSALISPFCNLPLKVSQKSDKRNVASAVYVHLLSLLLVTGISLPKQKHVMKILKFSFVTALVRHFHSRLSDI